MTEEKIYTSDIEVLQNAIDLIDIKELSDEDLNRYYAIADNAYGEAIREMRERRLSI